MLFGFNLLDENKKRENIMVTFTENLRYDFDRFSIEQIAI